MGSRSKYQRRTQKQSVDHLCRTLRVESGEETKTKALTRKGQRTKEEGREIIFDVTKEPMSPGREKGFV